MPRRHTTPRLIVAAALMLFVAACGGDDEPTETTVTTTAAPDDAVTTTVAATSEPDDTTALPDGPPPADYAGFREQTTACGADAPPAAADLRYDAPEDLGIDPSSRPVATISTSCGDIVIELDPSAAPETVNSFVFLAEEGFFDGTAVHRILPGFVMQGGDPTATGMGDPGYEIADEFPPADFSYATGVVAMANAGPGSTGSQFFIMLADAGLPPQYSVFATMIEGTDVLETISVIPTGMGSNGEPSTPLETLYIESITVER